MGSAIACKNVTNTPFRTAKNAAIAQGLVSNSSCSPPRDSERLRTPSSTANSMAAAISLEKHPYSGKALYKENLAPVAIPHAVPIANPNRFVLATAEPAAVDAVCVPWPIASLGDKEALTSSKVTPQALAPAAKNLAPINFLSHILLSKCSPTSHSPRHSAGTGGSPVTSNEGFSHEPNDDIVAIVKLIRP
ncbi:uncharacterized protein A4U43_C07F38070 [Asparagus officinalis]|uniref:Uncharacterized protein n=1 Tax=Asparagus officinalis TaxID=4686 RepID=A0A5P1EI07_ASPOF|nr:uncharacterized protein A4U43_C07F38070 [Asparagus officinalis]